MVLVGLWLLLSLVTVLCIGGDTDAKSEGAGLFGPNDDVEYAAIKSIHKQLDDNADGNVDFSESAEFVETELCNAGGEMIEGKNACTGPEKSLRFHLTDTKITSTELWVTWHKNQVFNWTTEDVLNWLEHYVELPQYSSKFVEHQITGRQLPHIAINSGQILQNTLLIADSKDRQKVQLRAMDVVLFGPPVQRGRWKDTILEISVVLIFCGMIYAFWQWRRSKAYLDSFMEDLRLKEEEIRRLTSKFEAIERESADGSENECQDDPSPPIMMSPAPSSSSSEEDMSQCKSCSNQALDSLSQAQQNVELLQQRVWVLEEELEARNRSYKLLQELLPECQHKEREQLEFRKSVGEEQMARAQRACDKIKKRRSSLFGSFHLANSSVLEETGLQITKALNKMQIISEQFEEHHKRWNRIAHLCGFHISSAHSPHQSPRESVSLINQDMLRFRYTSRSVLPKPFISTTSSPHFPSQPKPLATNVKSQGQSLVQGTTPKPVFQDRPTPLNKDVIYDRTVTDSVDSASSSGSSVSQPSALVKTNTWSSFGGRANGEVEEFPRRGISEGRTSGRGSREGSVDVTKGGGRLSSAESAEKKLLLMKQKRKVVRAASVFEELGQGSAEASPKGSPRQTTRRAKSSSTDV